MSSRIEGVVLGIVGIVCLFFQLWLPSTHVADADYQAVAETLKVQRQPGDVVLLAPWWTERARIFLPEGVPVVGYQGSEADALEKFQRIWVLSQPRLPNAQLGDFEKAFSPNRSPVTETQRFGNLALRLYTNGKYRPEVFNAADELQKAQVYLEGPDGSRQPCSWTGSAHRCPNGNVVGKEWHEVHFAPYSCIRLDAPGGQNRVVVEFTTPVAGMSSLSAGYIWEYGSYREGFTASTLTFEVDGRPQSLELPTGNELMHRLEGPAFQEGTRARIAFHSQNPHARVACVVMTLVGNPP